ncbi:alpha-lytic protease prodomain-containing protein [Streptomyces ficellus]|uniref:Alpha-lytic protease prodomain-containing protein n=1 Tax=Streptomyces ficellus TaxID=1977088 RepID=A0ABT7Z788_9ACTN|nr:carbohydrate-binding protein [Streptomyces ficellus]MDN3295364.1 alpha-lytic protease prodomain-containing protein [Streptomyces ficellus]
MLHRHATVACATLTAVGALVLAGPPGATAAESPAPPATPTATQTLGADKPSPALLDAMQRDLGLTRAQAETRLRNEAEAGARAGRLQNALGPRFAGAWLSGPVAATLTVATTDAADTATIKAGGAEPKVVRHALAQLDAAKAKLDQGSVRTKTTDAPVWYVDLRTNSVTLEAAKPAAAEVFLTATGIDRSLVRVKATTERPRPLHDIRGGDAYYIGDSRCSVGFAVTAAGQQGFATAGHCGQAGAATTGHNKVAQGTFKASTFPGKDMAWVATNADWGATAYVKGQGDQNVEVAGSTEALVGASICRSGSTTGWHCGTIEQHNTSVSYLQGTVKGLTRTTVCAEPGDSGGPYISGAQAQGVTSGGSGNCKDGGTTFHQPINPLLQDFQVTLKTNATDPGDTGKAGATWAAGKVYRVGDQVSHGGVTYRCVQSHQAQPGWRPEGTPALWQRV